MSTELTGPPESPADALLAFRDHPDWDEARADEAFLRLVARFSASDLLALARERLDDLGGADAPAILRLLEAFGAPEDLDRLADAVEAQADSIAPAVAYEALAGLDLAGRLDGRETLLELWGELRALDDPDAVASELAEQLEDGPDAVWVALQALGPIPAAERAGLLAGLATNGTAGPGTVEFLRAIALGSEPLSARAAAAILDGLDGPPAGVLEARTLLAARHPDLWPPQSALALALEDRSPTPTDGPARRPAFEVVRSLATGVDGRGRGRLAVLARSGTSWTLAGFRCDLERGVVEVEGEIGADPESVEAWFADLAEAPESFAMTDASDSVLGLLAGILLLCGPDAPPDWPFWIARAAGPEFGPRPFPALAVLAWDGSEPSGLAVLEACPLWADDSDLTRDLAREARLRGSDPACDLGAIRLLFERRLIGRVEIYRRMLLWMAAIWGASGASRLASAASATAEELADAQNLVPGHPFFREIAARGLRRASSRPVQDRPHLVDQP